MGLSPAVLPSLRRLLFPMVASSTFLLFAVVLEILLVRSFWAYWATGGEWYVRCGLFFGAASLFFSAGNGFWWAMILAHRKGGAK